MKNVSPFTLAGKALSNNNIPLNFSLPFHILERAVTVVFSVLKCAYGFCVSNCGRSRRGSSGAVSLTPYFGESLHSLLSHIEDYESDDCVDVFGTFLLGIKHV